MSFDKQIFRLTIPNIISNVTVPILGLVDTALMGHQKVNSELYLGAIALGTIIFNMIYWSSGFLRMSTSGFTSQAYGRDSKEDVSIELQRSLIVAFIIGVIVLLLQQPILDISLDLLNGTNRIKVLTSEYFGIRVWAAPAAIMLFAFNGWFLGMQNSKFPLYIALCINITNLALSYYLVKVWDMKSAGVALGTLIAQYAGLLLSIILLVCKYRFVFEWFSLIKVLKLDKLADFMKVNGDIFVRTLCIITVFTFFNARSSAMGEVTLAANSLLLQFLMFFSFFMDGLAYAGETLVGKYVGQNDKPSLQILVKRLVFWSVVIMIGFTLINSLFGKDLIDLLTSEESIAVRQEAYSFVVWIALIPVASFMSFMWDGVYVGATKSKSMRNTLLLSTFLVFFPVYYLTRRMLGDDALWLAMLLFFFVRGAYLAFMYKKVVLEE
ncbi:MAG: MATE family efflux transporter [Bacteroidales bacterium]